jgi:spore coat protein JB
MKNYKNMPDYYNYTNNNYNQPLYSQEPNMKSLYDPYQGFIRGNMFPELYNGYKLNNPLEVTPMNEQAELLTYVDALTFAMTDLNLYLDVYPQDRNAIELYNQYRLQSEDYLTKYENKFGPLLPSSDALMAQPWAWNVSPWPWEGR